MTLGIESLESGWQTNPAGRCDFDVVAAFNISFDASWFDNEHPLSCLEKPAQLDAISALSHVSFWPFVAQIRPIQARTVRASIWRFLRTLLASDQAQVRRTS